MRKLWFLGLFLEIVSTGSGTIGKQLIRLSSLAQKRAPASSTVFFHTGMFMNTLAGPILDMAAYSFAPQSLVAPFGGLDVVWNAALAPYMLGERLTWTRIRACSLIFSGTMASSVFGSHSDKNYDVELLKDVLIDKRVLIYLGLVALSVAFNIFVPMRKEKGNVWRGIALGTTAGTIAGNMFCVKAAVELIETYVWEGKGEVWSHWMIYTVLAGAIFFALTNVVFMTRGMLEFEALFMVTLYEGSMIVSNCVSASVILLELEGLEAWRVVLYVACVLVVCVGLIEICCAEARKDSAPQVEEDEKPTLDIEDVEVAESTSAAPSPTQLDSDFGKDQSRSGVNNTSTGPEPSIRELACSSAVESPINDAQVDLNKIAVGDSCKL